MNFLVKKFYEKLKENPNFEKKILNAKKKFNYIKEPKEKLCTIIEKVILPYADKLGYNFDVYDLLIFEEEASEQGAKLLESQVLEKVSGGQRDNNEHCEGIACYFEDLSKDDLVAVSEYWYEKNNEQNLIDQFDVTTN